MAIKKERITETEERNKKIKDMDIEEVKKYLCMKNMQNPEKCPNCASLSTCNAGQRVVVLMNEKGKRSVSERKADGSRKAAENRRKKTEQYIKQVLAAGDPRQFLMQNEGLNYQKAQKKLNNWRRNYPELFEGATWKKHHIGANKYTICKQKEHTEVKPVKEKDEISVEEFLSGIENQSAAEVEINAVIEPEQTAGHNACGIPNELVNSFSQIGEEMDRVKKQISDLNDKYNRLKKAQDAISMTMDLLKPDSKVMKELMK